MTNRVGLFLLLAVGGTFTAAVLLVLAFPNEPSRIVGALLLACGLVALVFARHVAAAATALDDKLHIPKFLHGRPFTFALWGAGLALLGILQLLGI
jgi:hypothetical protein